MADAPPAATPPPAAPPPAPAGPPPTDWKASVSEANRGHPSIKDLKSIDDAVGKLIAAEGMIGADKVVVPGKEAKPEQWDKFYNSIGRPESPKDYEVPTEGVPKVAGLMESVEKFRPAAHEIGLTKQQFAKLVRFEATRFEEAMKAHESGQLTARVEAEETLKKNWGNAYEQNMKLAQEALIRVGSPELRKLADDTGIGNNPAYAEFLLRVGKLIMEDSVHGTGTRAGMLTPGEAKEQIALIRRDKEFMKSYTTQADPDHKQAVEKMERLFKAANPTR